MEHGEPYETLIIKSCKVTRNKTKQKRHHNSIWYSSLLLGKIFLDIRDYVYLITLHSLLKCSVPFDGLNDVHVVDSFQKSGDKLILELPSLAIWSHNTHLLHPLLLLSTRVLLPVVRAREPRLTQDFGCETKQPLHNL